jgi:hypothetical protein
MVKPINCCFCRATFGVIGSEPTTVPFEANYDRDGIYVLRAWACPDCAREHRDEINQRQRECDEWLANA